MLRLSLRFMLGKKQKMLESILWMVKVTIAGFIITLLIAMWIYAGAEDE